MGLDYAGDRVGTPCPTCGFPRVRVAREVLRQLLEEVRPRLWSLPRNPLSEKLESYAVCPQCNAYALGIDLHRGYPFTDAEGRELVIQDIEEELWKT